MRAHGAARRRAFTLVELLVVIGIIALLISILLPALSKAKEAANTAACMANLRSIGQAMQTYVGDYRGWIPGSGNTSASHIWLDGASFALKPGISATNCPEVVELNDFIGPLCKIMRVALPNTNDTVPRFREYRKLRQFTCPSFEGVIATKFSGPATMEDGQAMSYLTALTFLMKSYRTGWTGSVRMPAGPSNNSFYWELPPSYAPKINQVGSASEKIYAAENGRWTNGTAGPTFTLKPGELSWHNNTNFSDFGAFTGATKSFARRVPNGMTATIDPRIFSYRHGAKSQRATTPYRMNVLFYDGHVATMTDMESAKPDYWLPRGTMIGNPNASIAADQPVVYPDVVANYKITSNYLVQ